MPITQSKFRHIYAKEAKDTNSWFGIKSGNAQDGEIISGNAKFFSCIWSSAGGGAFIVLDINKPKKIERQNLFLVSGHKRSVLDTAWNPFNLNHVASSSEDSSIKLWEIPDNGLENNLTSSIQTLNGHRHKVHKIYWSPAADGVLASCSYDQTVKLWDVENGECKQTVSNFKKYVSCLSFKNDCSVAVAGIKGGDCVIQDFRLKESSVSWKAHLSSKSINVKYVSKSDQVLSVGHNKMSERELFLWDLRDTSEPVSSCSLGISPSSMFLWFDEDLGIVYLAGKGDSGIKYFEIIKNNENKSELFGLNEYRSPHPQKGLCVLPKYVNSIYECETMRFLKVDNKNKVTPIKFYVPRKSDTFQQDIFPDTPGWVPAMSASDYFSGKNSTPKLVNLENLDLSSIKKREVEITLSLSEQLKQAKERIAELEKEIEKLKNSK